MADVGFSCSHPLGPGQHYLQALDIGLHVEFEAMWEDESRYNITIASDYSKHHEVDWVFGFHQYWYILWILCKPMVDLSVYHLFLAEIFLIWNKTKACLDAGDAWVGLLQHGLSFCLSWPMIKIGLFPFVWETANVFMHYLSDKKTQTLSCPWLLSWLTCWDHCQSWTGSRQQIQKFFFDQDTQ